MVFTRSALFALFIFGKTSLNAQPLRIITTDHSVIEVLIISDSVKRSIIQLNDGKEDTSLYKKWTARTYLLNNQQIIIEFFDRQAALVNTIK
ncbi:MAG: hypothetical protein J7497_13800, partial [Chitinophagaceae bacterium]|nr:hypothetical protein [Chitinophagaceae bacterium]